MTKEETHARVVAICAQISDIPFEDANAILAVAICSAVRATSKDEPVCIGMAATICFTIGDLMSRTKPEPTGTLQ